MAMVSATESGKQTIQQQWVSNTGSMDSSEPVERRGNWNGRRSRRQEDPHPQNLTVTVVVVMSNRECWKHIVPGIDVFVTFGEFKMLLSEMYFQGGKGGALELLLRDRLGRVLTKDDSEIVSTFLRDGDVVVVERNVVVDEDYDGGDDDDEDERQGNVRFDQFFEASKQQMASWVPFQDFELFGTLQQDPMGTTSVGSSVWHEEEVSQSVHRFGTVIVRGTCSQYDASDVSVGSSACTSVCFAAAKYLLVDYAHVDLELLSAKVLDVITRHGVELYGSAVTHCSVDELWSLPRYQAICAALYRDSDLPPYQQMATHAGFEAGLESCLSQMRLRHDGSSFSSLHRHCHPLRVAIILTKPPETVLLVYVRNNEKWYMLDSHGEAFPDRPKVTYLMCFHSLSLLASALVTKFPILSDRAADLSYNRFEATPLVAAIDGAPATAASQNVVDSVDDEGSYDCRGLWCGDPIVFW